jgi:molybdopterin-guanine dinucleotide biosynthesis protein A
MTVDVVLPAGGRIAGEFAREAGADVKALVRLGGWTILERTLATLEATGRVGRTVVIGPEEVRPIAAARAVSAVLPEGESGPANIMRGLEWLHDANGGHHAKRVLVLTTDLPFLTPEAIVKFLDACPSDSAICMPILNGKEFEERFSYREARYLRLRDGEWMIGCAFLIDPAAVMDNRDVIESVFAARRSKLGMVRLLGPLFALRFVTHRLTVQHIEERCLQILRCTGKSIRCTAPELAFDLDYLDDYRYAVRFAV